MTPREFEILNTMYQLGGSASAQAISKKTGLSLLYSQVLSQALLKQRLLEQTANRLFVLTAQGRLVVGRRSKVGETSALGLTEAAHLVSRHTSILPILPLEPSFLSEKFMEEPVSFIQHNFNKNQTVELADTRSIQAGIDGLISIKK